MNIPPSFSVFHLPIFRAIHLFFPTMFLDFNPIFVETAQFLSAKRKIVWLRTILRCAANELRTYRTPPKRHSDVIICPKKDPSPLLYLSSKKAFTRSYFLYTNALRWTSLCFSLHLSFTVPSPPIGFHWTTRKVKRCKPFTLTHYKTRSMNAWRLFYATVLPAVNPYRALHFSTAPPWTGNGNLNWPFLPTLVSSTWGVLPSLPSW